MLTSVTVITGCPSTSATVAVIAAVPEKIEYVISADRIICPPFRLTLRLLTESRSGRLAVPKPAFIFEFTASWVMVIVTIIPGLDREIVR